MISLAVVGNELIHRYVYPGYINGFDRGLMDKHGGWMADLHRTSDGRPMNPDIKITAIASTDTQLASSIALVCGIDEVLRELTDEQVERLDGALLMERDGAVHFEMARPFLEKGKFVYFDKPVAHKISDVEAMRDIAERTGATVMGGSALRYSEQVSKVKAALAQSPAQSLTVSGPGPWYDYACHLVELLVVLNGPKVSRVSGLGKQTDGNIHIEWENGATALLQYGCAYKTFTVHAHDGDTNRMWTVEDGTVYYRGLSAAICDALTSTEKPSGWDDITAVVHVLEQGARCLEEAQ